VKRKEFQSKSLLPMVLVVAFLTACSSTAGSSQNNETGGSEQDTTSVIYQTNPNNVNATYQDEDNIISEPAGQRGQPGEMPDGLPPRGQPGEIPDGFPPPGQPGEIPDGLPPRDQPGEMPDGFPPPGQPGEIPDGLPPRDQPGEMPDGFALPGQQGGHYEPVNLAVTSDLVDSIMASYSGKSFKDGSVPDDILEAILQCGQKAPSAMNAQPWRFTVIKNSEIASQFAVRDYHDGSVIIVVSGKPDERTGGTVTFDCALATQNMYLAAQSLGYGAHIYLGGVQNINDNMKEALEIPDDYVAQIIMLIGNYADDVDAVTSASPRTPLGDNVNYIE